MYIDVLLHGRPCLYILEVFHPEVLQHTNKYFTPVINTAFSFIYNAIYVRATCFDLVGHPQALQEKQIQELFSFLHCGIPNVFLGGPEDDLLGRNVSS